MVTRRASAPAARLDPRLALVITGIVVAPTARFRQAGAAKGSRVRPDRRSSAPARALPRRTRTVRWSRSASVVAPRLRLRGLRGLGAPRAGRALPVRSRVFRARPRRGPRRATRYRHGSAPVRRVLRGRLRSVRGNWQLTVRSLRRGRRFRPGIHRRRSRPRFLFRPPYGSSQRSHRRTELRRRVLPRVRRRARRGRAGSRTRRRRARRARRSKSRRTDTAVTSTGSRRADRPRWNASRPWRVAELGHGTRPVQPHHGVPWLDLLSLDTVGSYVHYAPFGVA